jgi:OmcA/MtrC family decaheme c-type cytochrome
MKFSLVRCGMAALVAALVAGCGGGGSSDAGAPPAVTPPPTATVLDAVKAAAAVAANDTSINSSASFTVLQNAGVPAVTVNSPLKVNFAVFSDGAVKSDLKITNVSFVIAKLLPGTSGNPDQWVNYIYRKETAAAGVGPNGKPALASAMQATTDGKQTDAALLAAQLVYNADGYYTYTFKTDIKDPAQTNGVVFEPNRTHRIAIQLSYTNAAGETVRVNPYFDFTIDANGKSVAVTDPSKTRKMTDVSSCNSCHDKLALHGGGRVDTQLCVMCHNPGTTDANSGNVLTLSTMVHKIHSGRLLKQALDAGKGGEDYTIWGYGNSKHDYAEVGFPQDLRNCAKCHTGANASTPQGDNWKTKVSKEACLTCHASKAGSDWNTNHTIYASPIVGKGAAATDIPNEICAACHKPGSNISPERVHFNQVQVNGAKYKMNIESTSYDAATRMVTVKYFLSDPTNGDKAYNLVTSECTGTSTISCANTTKFGNLRFYLAYQNMVGQSTAVTEFSAYNNGGNSANAYAYKGVNDGNNHYTVQIPVPADTATAVAAGTARVVSIGQVKEPELVIKSAADPRPEVSPRNLVNVAVQNTFKELALTGTLNPRRTIVASEKCNACHGMLGTTSGSNTLANAFHGGARNIVEACVVCHDANRMSSSTIMTNGLALNEAYQFKRMIHGIHGGAARTYAFTHGNTVVGAFGLNGNSLTGGAPLSAQVNATTGAPLVTNFSTEVAWPGPTAVGTGIDCNACHVNNSYKRDLSPLGAVVAKPTGVTDPMGWLVISPKAATCTACHDSAKAIGHVTSFGSASFANRSQKDSLMTQETCDDCHAPGGFKGVDLIHGQK